MSELLIESSLMAAPSVLFDSAAASSATYCDSPLSDALGMDELDLLHQLLDFPEPAGASNTFAKASAAAASPSLKRERCADCAAHALERSAKRPRATSTDGKPAKSKSQSQRQKEEISLLKQQVEQLNAKLAKLHERKRQRELANDSVTSETSAGDRALVHITVGGGKRMWESVAKRQHAELRNMKEANVELRGEVSKCWKKMKSLERSIIMSQVDHLRQANQHVLADELSALVGSA